MSSGKIYLRPLMVEDASKSYQWRNDPELWKYTGRAPDRLITEAMEIEWAHRVIADQARKNFAICEVGTDRYIGNIYLVNIHDHAGELGIFIGDRTAQGHGYGQMALRILMDEARKIDLKTILIKVSKDNVSALVTYLKCGAKLPDSWDGAGMLTMTLLL